MGKSPWRIVAFPVFVVIAALFVPACAALSSAGWIPDWVLIILCVVWFFGLFPALFAVINWIV